MLVEIILNNVGQHVTDKLVTDIKTKRVTKYGAVNASGKLADSVRYDVSNGGETLRVYAEDYIYYLVNGRKNGRRPPKDAIRRWIDEKGIQPQDISKDSLAFLIARKIGESGTTIYQQGGSDLVSDTINDELVIETRDKLQEEIIALFKADLVGIELR